VAIIERIEEIEKQIAELKKQVEEEKPVIRWRAKKCSDYYSITSNGDDLSYFDRRQYGDDYRYNTGNYFKTEQEARDYKRRLLIEQQIKDIALNLNDGEEIDWNDSKQPKFYINYSVKNNNFDMFDHYHFIGENAYCLSNKFLKTVLNEVGEEDLKFYYGVE